MRLTCKSLTLEAGQHDRTVSEPSADVAARVAGVTRLLPAEDRRLIDLLLVRGLSHRAAATVLRVSAGAITRRVRRIRNLIASPTIRAIAEHHPSLASPLRELAIDHFFNRIPVTLLCRRFDLTRRDVQAQLDYVRGWARALHRAALRAAEEAARERAEADE